MPTEAVGCYGDSHENGQAKCEKQCKEFGSEEECLMLTNDDGEPRYHFEPLGEYEDCETAWPTTTTTAEEIGCCNSGVSHKANDKCPRASDRARCADMGCESLVTMTSTPTTGRSKSMRKVDGCVGAFALHLCG